ncbi:AAA family ATPase [Neolewinella persica]|uniref:AAA family ATPase n=1 Tax=Neolewinella persica TaxID=70998 RepID=UPI000365CEF0|nr:MoxR family ATPase [Neolewinella persica]
MNTSQHLPTGAEALLIALATPSPQGLTGIPVLLWGRPGVGKSSFIEGLATKDLAVTTLIASIHDPTDFSGLPVLEDGKVNYAVPRWVDDFKETETGILFLDELSTAPPSVQSALLRVVFERKVGFHPLPSGVRIVAAANPPDLMVGGWELSPPLRNRFVHLNWDIPADVYINALNHGWEMGVLPEIDPAAHAEKLREYQTKITGFFRIKPDALHASPEENKYGFASPRSWDFAAALLAAADLLGYHLSDGGNNNVLFELTTGCLGEPVAIMLLEYLTNLRLPDPVELLSGKTSIDLKDFDDGEVFVLFASLNDQLKHVSSEDELLAYSRVYLTLAEVAFSSGRRDVVFVPLKDLARTKWMHDLVNAAQAAGPDELADVHTHITSLFSDPGLNEFISVLS